MTDASLTSIPPGQARDRFLPLLRLADDSETEIRSYYQSGRLFAFEADGAVLGMTLVMLEPDHAELKSVAVDPAMHGRGIGRQMLRLVLDELRAIGVHRVIVGTAGSSIGQLAFYQKAGFRMASIERDFFNESRGYSAGLEENGIPLRDMVWMDMELGTESRAGGR